MLRGLLRQLHNEKKFRNRNSRNRRKHFVYEVSTRHSGNGAADYLRRGSNNKRDIADKFKPQNVVFAGLLLASVCNAVFPLFDSIVAFTIIWAINGFGQAMFWPAMVKIIAEYLSPFKYKMACSHILTASQLATVVLYLLVPLVLNSLGYTWVFYIAAIVGAIMSLIWIIAYNALIKGCEKYRHENNSGECVTLESTEPKPKVKLAPIMVSCGMITILIGIVLQGCLRDGITTWMPSFIVDSGSDNASTAILKNVLLPAFSVLP